MFSLSGSCFLFLLCHKDTTWTGFRMFSFPLSASIEKKGFYLVTACYYAQFACCPYNGFNA